MIYSRRARIVTTPSRRKRPAQADQQSKLTEARGRVAEQQARERAARPANDPVLPRKLSPRTTPREQRPSALATAPPVLLSLADLREHYGITYTRQHLYRLMDAGKFPRSVALGPEVYARKAWRREDVERWVANLAYTNEGEAA
jgi:predicted DNA-binding transcriptional regulator AlpA